MSEVSVTPDATGDTQEHIDAMVAKADNAGKPKADPALAAAAATEGAPAETAERPAWLPEKFKSGEDLAKAYAAVVAKMSGKQDAATDEAPAEAAEELSQEEAQNAAEAAVEKAGLDMDALGQKIIDQGHLDDSDYEALKAAGISKEMVDSYVEGQRALGQQMVSRMQAVVGGEEQFNSLIEWAAENLPADEIETFNGIVDNGSEGAVKLALEGLNAKYKASGNNPPKLVAGGKATGGGDQFRSVAELTKAMNDPRYSRDAAYRADVAERLARSSIL